MDGWMDGRGSFLNGRVWGSPCLISPLHLILFLFLSPNDMSLETKHTQVNQIKTHTHTHEKRFFFSSRLSSRTLILAHPETHIAHAECVCVLHVGMPTVTVVFRWLSTLIHHDRHTQILKKNIIFYFVFSRWFLSFANNKCHLINVFFQPVVLFYLFLFHLEMTSRKTKKRQNRKQSKMLMNAVFFISLDDEGTDRPTDKGIKVHSLPSIGDP